MSVKVTSDMIRLFSGNGDVLAWLKKVQLVAQLQKITDLVSSAIFGRRGICPLPIDG